MTKEQINQTIAGACGWTVIGHSDGLLMGCRPGNSTIRNPIPNYHGDLNACAEMEKTLAIDLEYQYAVQLAIMTIGQEFSDDGFSPNGWGYYAVLHATAPQRAEAFCRTLGLWEDGE